VITNNTKDAVYTSLHRDPRIEIDTGILGRDQETEGVDLDQENEGVDPDQETEEVGLDQEAEGAGQDQEAEIVDHDQESVVDLLTAVALDHERDIVLTLTVDTHRKTNTLALQRLIDCPKLAPPKHRER